ncbi:hypothetical protein SBA1_480060 [Candidatus Sulfotelmatobacter kueseliae]|uniref:Uncharacterized protein n=1 Tax=Candidatus Sulfotelmatobacter kueseliae TaxID=2042962 RepID=A0A2U3KUB5_9BACT|nr:hypothetical protein SBA1_480060 [Candidatus Sulfotelmatobacter kueseliae]
MCAAHLPRTPLDFDTLGYYSNHDRSTSPV